MSMKSCFVFLTSLSFAGAACMPPVAAHAPSGESSPSGPAPSGRDPAIQALAAKAAACSFEDGAFDEECDAYKAWSEAEEPFEDGKGDATLVSMLEDADEKVRLLATKKSPSPAFVEQPAIRQRLRAAFAKEKNEEVRREHVRIFAKMSAKQPEVVALWQELAKHPSVEVRHTLGFYLSQPHPAALAVSRTLASDPEARVREGALVGIQMATDFGKNEPACQALVEILGREDDLDGHVAWTASSTYCASVQAPLLASLLAHTSDAARVDRGVVRYSLAVDAFCREGSLATPDQKRKAFEVARRLVDPKVRSNRSSAVKSLASCDPVAGKPLVAKLAGDKDASVVREAKEALAKLAAPKAPARK